MRSLASPFRVKWFAALAGGGVSQTEEKVVFKEAHDRALVSSWGAALGPLCYGTTSVVERVPAGKSSSLASRRHPSSRKIFRDTSPSAGYMAPRFSIRIGSVKKALQKVTSGHVRFVIGSARWPAHQGLRSNRSLLSSRDHALTKLLQYSRLVWYDNSELRWCCGFSRDFPEFTKAHRWEQGSRHRQAASESPDQEAKSSRTADWPSGALLSLLLCC